MSETAPTEMVRPHLRILWGSATDVGNLRRVNEDSYSVGPGLWAVADGMGGHKAGDVASKIATNACSELALGVPLDLEQVTDLVSTANQRVREESAHADQLGMGTTLVGVALISNGDEDALLVFNVGDSRCYGLVDGDTLTQYTVDHSHVQELVDAGEISIEEALNHPERNVVTRAIGIDTHLSADFLVLPQNPATRILLCSDGVSGEITDPELEQILATGDSPTDTAERLLEAVIAGPARDNATAVVLDVYWEAVDGLDGHDVHSQTTGPRPPYAAKSTNTVPSIIAEVPIDAEQDPRYFDADPPDLIEGIPKR